MSRGTYASMAQTKSLQKGVLEGLAAGTAVRRPRSSAMSKKSPPGPLDGAGFWAGAGAGAEEMSSRASGSAL